ncbi:MAG: bifunctional ornithine acetyltransferase/N-acetylglutamate synthase [Nitrospirota bacterium]
MTKRFTIHDTRFKIKGFKASGIFSGIKRQKRKDLALIFSEVESSAAGMFTTNKIKAAPVRLCIERIKSGKGQAIVANSGNANACTGIQGYRDAIEMSRIAAENLGINRGGVYVSSTGVIGKPLPMEKIEAGIKKAVKKLSPEGFSDAAEAITTTDTFPKLAFEEVIIGGERVSILGIAKGSGMIHPKFALNPVSGACPDPEFDPELDSGQGSGVSGMATMLSFILSDAAIDATSLSYALKNAVESSFNKITVDGETSTNDTVIALSNGIAKNRPINQIFTEEFSLFQSALNNVTQSLARMLVKDGEGATRFIEILVDGASTLEDAENIAFSIANSPLVKTAFYGGDVNWGRIMVAIGNSGVDVYEERIDISFDDLKVVECGVRVSAFAEVEASKILKKERFRVTVDLNIGNSSVNIWTTDMSPDYIKMNASYRT